MNTSTLIKVFPEVRRFLPVLDQAFDFADINTDDRKVMFLAQVGHESQGFTRLRENMNYSAQGLANTWPTRYSLFTWKVKNGKQVKHYLYRPNQIALKLHRKPVEIANFTYANRFGNGPVESGDGYKFRGGGLMHTTFYDNYKRVDDLLFLNGKLLALPEMITEPYYAALSAAIYWKDNNLNPLADQRKVTAVRRKINGGIIGIEHVQGYYDLLIDKL